MSSHGPPPAPLHRVTGARTLPDADLSQLADFMQCCNEIGFDWRCVFPPGGGDGEHADATANFAAKLDSGMCLAAEEDEDDEETAVESSTASYDGGGASSSTCYLGTHSLHLAGAAPLLFPLCYPSDSFDEPPCYRHATSESGGGRWAPMRCPTCDGRGGYELRHRRWFQTARTLTLSLTLTLALTRDAGRGRRDGGGRRAQLV